MLASPFPKPKNLVFAARVDSKRVIDLDRYTYQGNFNQAPFDLTQCPANSLLLRREAQLHEWLKTLQPLQDLSTEPTYQLACQSIGKQVVDALNELFRWKAELYIQQHVVPPVEVATSGPR
ncbi:hypothetical protein MD484_g9108, partial [Candolleomyces efflorescens]